VVVVVWTGIVDEASVVGVTVVVARAVSVARVVGGWVAASVDGGIEVAPSSVVGGAAGAAVVVVTVGLSGGIDVGAGIVVGASLVVVISGAVGTVTVTITVTVGVGPGIVVGTLTAEPGTCTMITCGATVVAGVVSGAVVVGGSVSTASVAATFTSVVAMISDLDFDDRPFVEMIAAAIVAQPMMIAPMMGASLVR
jgi:hypothetical protein